MVEDAALTWFRELGHAVGHGPLAPGEHAGGTLTPGLSQGEREVYGDVMSVGRLREAIQRLNPAMPQSRTLATLRDTLLPKLLSEEVSVAVVESKLEGVA